MKRELTGLTFFVARLVACGAQGRSVIPPTTTRSESQVRVTCGVGRADPSWLCDAATFRSHLTYRCMIAKVNNDEKSRGVTGILLCRPLLIRTTSFFSFLATVSTLTHLAPQFLCWYYFLLTCIWHIYHLSARKNQHLTFFIF